MPGLAEAIVQVGGDDAIGSLGVGEIVRVAGMRAGLRLQLLAGNQPQVGRIGRRMRVGSGSRVLVVAAVTVTGLAARTLRPAVGAVQRDAVQTRADQHGEQEAGQR